MNRLKALGATKITICSESAQLETFLSRLFNLNGIAVKGKWAPEQYCIVKLWNWNTVYRVNDAQRSIRRLNEAQRKTKSLVQLKHLFLRVLRTNILDAQSKHRHWHMSGIGFCVKPGWLADWLPDWTLNQISFWLRTKTHYTNTEKETTKNVGGFLWGLLQSIGNISSNICIEFQRVVNRSIECILDHFLKPIMHWFWHRTITFVFHLGYGVRHIIICIVWILYFVYGTSTATIN